MLGCLHNHTSQELKVQTCYLIFVASTQTNYYTGEGDVHLLCSRPILQGGVHCGGDIVDAPNGIMSHQGISVQVMKVLSLFLSPNTEEHWRGAGSCKLLQACLCPTIIIIKAMMILLWFIVEEKGDMSQDGQALRLTVGLLVAGTGSRTAELLGLAAPGVGNQQASVVGQEDILDLLLGGFVHICWIF
jgi:hypothetical protein